MLEPVTKYDEFKLGEPAVSMEQQDFDRHAVKINQEAFHRDLCIEGAAVRDRDWRVNPEIKAAAVILAAFDQPNFCMTKLLPNLIPTRKFDLQEALD